MAHAFSNYQAYVPQITPLHPLYKHTSTPIAPYPPAQILHSSVLHLQYPGLSPLGKQRSRRNNAMSITRVSLLCFAIITCIITISLRQEGERYPGISGLLWLSLFLLALMTNRLRSGRLAIAVLYVLYGAYHIR